ncbi:MAG: hypothetical protein CSB06_03895 [Bacteroidia bacterium]|nr:MAG: hypothetical protein CSB06_03895 [Bacteroidia bacterium]
MPVRDTYLSQLNSKHKALIIRHLHNMQNILRHFDFENFKSGTFLFRKFSASLHLIKKELCSNKI